MNNSTQILQSDIKTMLTTFDQVYNEAKDLENLWFKGSVSSDISGNAGSDPVTFSTQLTKNQLTSGITFCQNIIAFFNNSAPTQSDYMATIQDLLYGTATATFINNTVEALGNRIVELMRQCVLQYNRSRLAENNYNSTEISAMAGAISTYQVIYGADMTKDQLTSAITLAQDWQDLLTNVDPGTSDRKVTLGKWLTL